MTRALTLAALALAAFSACSNDPEVPQAVAVAMTAPQEAADKEVLIATQPSQAKVLLQGAEVGVTPMKLLIRDDTNVVLEKEGYVRQALMLTQKSDPNVVVTLVPAGDVAAPAPAPAAAPASAPVEHRGSSGRQASKKGPEESGSPGAPETPPAPAPGGAETAAPVAPSPPAAATPPAPKKTEYANMRQIKEALRAGKITRDEYSQWQGIIRRNREAEYDAAKKDLRERRITEAQYEEKIRAIRAKYEG